LSDIDRFNYVIGTQTIGAAYQFTAEPRIVETACAILDMGSNTLKFRMSKDYFGKNNNVAAANPAIKSLTDLARDEPAHKAVLDMPFADYIIWSYCFSPGWWHSGFSKEDQEKEYREFHEFASYLLRTYSGSGKRFYLGHWEGDWHLRNGYDTGSDAGVTPEAIQGMIDWLNIRQRAVDDANRDTPHKDVWVYNYTEVNLVKIAAMQGRPCVTNSVLPHTNVDYVSYSSYDSGLDLGPSLDYIASKLQPKAGIKGKRVWIGEYGFPAIAHSPAEQDQLSRKVMRAGLEWGCPFVLYWELYNNEIDKDGTQRGFWLIDDKGGKPPVYETHRSYYAWARRFVADFRKAQGRVPTAEEFRKQAVLWLDQPK
jgi:hypothetical protein